MSNPLTELYEPKPLSKDDLDFMLANLDKFTDGEIEDLYEQVDKYAERVKIEAAHNDLIAFCCYMQADYKVGAHHRILADLLMEIEETLHNVGKETEVEFTEENGSMPSVSVEKKSGKDRICVNIPPRHGKSQLVSIYFPAWFLGRNPTMKVMMVSHTTDLAVDFGRKVRNLISTDPYKKIFPTVTLSVDSKSAGRWNTNSGGEYYACLRLHTKIHTTKGHRPAGEIAVGDVLLNAGSPVKVLEVYRSRHEATYKVNGLDCSSNHPIWTMNRGWVYAKDILPDDCLCVESILGRMRALIWRAYGCYLEHTNVPQVVQHKITLQQPQQREVEALRWPRHLLVRAVGTVREFCRGYGAAAHSEAYSGAGRQRWPLQSRELSLGDNTAAAKQQAYQRFCGGEDLSPECSGFGYNTGNNTVQDSPRAQPAVSNQEAEEELRTYGNPEGLGWLRSAAARLLTHSRESDKTGQPQSRAEGYMAGARRTAKNLLGFCLGVRRAGTVQVAHHVTPHPFVNFLTDGDHTFFAEGVLTHNCGVGSALAGRGAHLLLIDDPHSEQDVLNGNYDVFDRAYEWYTFGARTRLMPGGAVAIVQCMVGDTNVLLPDGTEKRLDCVRPGDVVATYDKGKLAKAKVLNWMNQGPDHIYTVSTTDGRSVRANDRHPFLVLKPDGDTEWIRLRNLRPGMALVSMKGAAGLEGRKQSRVSAAPAKQTTTTTSAIPAHSTNPVGTTVSIKEKLASLRGAVYLQRVGTGVLSMPQHTGITSLKPVGRGSTMTQPAGAITTSKQNMASTILSTLGCWRDRGASVLSASLGWMRLKYRVLGVTQTPSLLTTATIPVGLGGSSAMTATSLSNNTLTKDCYAAPFTTSTISEVTFSGREDVFDIEVDRTHNFIANAIVSSNTRWHLDDMTGRVVRDMHQNPQADQYEVIEFPAILEVDDPENPGEVIEKALWPGFFELEALHRTRASMPLFQWNAQYQQNPTSEESAIIAKDKWNTWRKEKPPTCEYLIMSLDSAAETKNRSDFTALTTWGVFFNEQTDAYNLILLNSIKKRVEFPELKALCLEEYKDWQPDSFIVEKKSSGVALYQEIRRMGIPAKEYTPHRGSGDKMARLNSVADIIVSGLCWVPETRWAEELVEEIAAFPVGRNDDLVDSTVMALMRFRQGGFIKLPSDMEEEQPDYRRKRGYY